MKEIFDIILELSISTSVIILVVLALRFILKKHSKSFSYYLWVLVFIKLILPFSFEVEKSFVPQEVQDIIVVDVQTRNQSIDLENIINNQNNQSEFVFTNTNKEDINKEIIINNSPLESTAINNISVNKEINYQNYIWIFGVIILISYFILSLINVNKSIRFAYKDRRNIYLCEDINIPFILGVTKPVIYLPENINEDDKMYIVRHENVHIKRLDYIIKPICFLICIIHWFNPLVWISFILMNKDMEMSCDEEVIKSLGSQYKKDYSKALLNFAIKENNYSMVAVLFGEKEPENRIMNILKYKKPQKILIAVFSLVLIGLLIILFTNEKPKDESDISVLQNIEAENIDYNMDNVKWQDRSFVIATYYNLEENNNEYENFGLLDFGYNITPIFNDVEDKSDERYLLQNLGVNEPRDLAFEDYTTGTYSKDNEYLSLANLPKDREESVVEFYSFKDLFLIEKYEYDFSGIIPEIKVDNLIVYEKINDGVEFLVFQGTDENVYILKAENKVWQVQSKFLSEHSPYATVRFINENIGIYGYQDRNDNFPNAKMTYDGGKTWTELDFSSFSLYDDINYETYDVFINGSNIKISTGVAKGFNFVSDDFGQSWAMHNMKFANRDKISYAADMRYLNSDIIISLEDVNYKDAVLTYLSPETSEIVEYSFKERVYSLENLGIENTRVQEESYHIIDNISAVSVTSLDLLYVANLLEDENKALVEFIDYENFEVINKETVDFSKIVDDLEIRYINEFDMIDKELGYITVFAEDGNSYLFRRMNDEWELIHTVNFQVGEMYAFGATGVIAFPTTEKEDEQIFLALSISRDYGDSFQQIVFKEIEDAENYYGGNIEITNNVMVFSALNVENGQFIELKSYDLGQSWEYETSKFIISEYTIPITADEYSFNRGFVGEYPEHNGIDLTAMAGTEIMASKAGVVTTAEYSPAGYGKHIIIDHGDGVETLYAQCSEISVYEGQEVSQGEVVALVGTTGWSTGNHLHFEVRVNGVTVDPLNYLPNSVWPATDFRWSRGFEGQYPEYNGISLAIEKGGDIVAYKSGTVIEASYTEDGYGWHVKIYHADGTSSLYALCDELLVEVGQTVNVGQKIATGGVSKDGYEWLHFEIIDKDGETRLDPINFIP